LATQQIKRKAKAGAALVIPDKLYFRIGEVAKLLDLQPYVLRFWESEFPQLKPGKAGTGQRLYKRRDVETLAEIRRLLYDEGYTIPGARQALKTETRKPAEEPVPPPAAKPASEDTRALRLRKLRSDLEEVANMLERPADGRKKTSHRGLSVASRRNRQVLEMPPPLFADTTEPPTK